jgi:hypothetical protein
LLIESAPDKVTAVVFALKKKITDHFKTGGRVKIIHSDGAPAQELLPNFTFRYWKD